MAWLGLAIIAIVIGIGTILMYNRLVAARNDVRNLWRQIDVQLKRRYDLIPNLVSAVKDVLQWEKETLTQVIEARAQAVGAKDPGERAKADSMVTAALGKLFAVVERYPELKSNENVKQLMGDLTATENAIATARSVYNSSVLDYSNLRESVPTNFVAVWFQFEPAAYFEAADADREVPRVALR